MPNTTVKLAMGQMLVEGGKLRENLERAAEMIRNLARLWPERTGRVAIRPARGPVYRLAQPGRGSTGSGGIRMPPLRRA